VAYCDTWSIWLLFLVKANDTSLWVREVGQRVVSWYIWTYILVYVHCIVIEIWVHFLITLQGEG